MKRHASFVLYALALPLLGRQADAACLPVENPELVEYSCEGGSADDLKVIPSNAEKIRISHMPLGHVSEETFSRFAENLVVLTCSYCQISDIEDNAFGRLQNLQQLSLDNNRLTKANGAWFAGLRDLTYLDLNYNRIESVAGDIFRSSPALVDLRLSGNRLHCLDLEGMSGLKDLKRIFLSENPEFGCPNALRRFLADRSVDFEFDPSWASAPEDRVIAVEPAPAVPPAGVEAASPTPPQVPRTRWTATEEPATYPPTPEAPVTTTSITTTTTTEAPPPPRRPYVPEMMQPSVPEQDFAYQGPYYAPKVTQQQLDGFRNAATAPARGGEQEVQEKEETERPVVVEAPTRATVLAAGVASDEASTTTECPNAAGPAGESSLPAVLAVAAASLCLSRWTSAGF